MSAARAAPVTDTVTAAPESEPGRRGFAVDCTLAYDFPQSTSLVFQVHALHGRDQQVLAEALELTPAVESRVFLDPLHHHRFLRLQAPPGPLTLRYRAQVQVLPRAWPADAPEASVQDLPDEVLHHLLPTRFCESDLLANASLRLFGGLPPGRARVQAIADWIFDNVEYRIGASDSTTTARDVFVRRAGVCRDFAHLGATFCRALNIPARLVAAYAKFGEPPPDFHALFEAYLGGEWILFDPTRMAPVEDIVRIASGRDAKDIAFATLFGPAAMTTMAPLLEPLAAASPAKAAPARRRKTAGTAAETAAPAARREGGKRR
ncbi:MAG: transglutaminase family protein [Rubrivivax sp.]